MNSVPHQVNESGGQSREAQPQDTAVQAFAAKFNLSLDKAKQLIELHRAALAREVKKPKNRYR
jgi:hypothetical protein